MDCRHIRELLPLYAGGDLEEKHSKLVTEHLQWCAECANSADDYRDTRQLLQQFAAPRFSDALYAGIRRRVWQEIERESPRQTLPQLVANLVRPRPKWAFATALLFAVCLFIFYLSHNPGKEPHQSANSPAVDRSTPGKQTNARSEKRTSAVATSSPGNTVDGPRRVLKGIEPGRAIEENAAIAGAGVRGEQSQRRKRSRLAAVQSRSVAVNTSESRSLTVESARKSNSLVPAGDPASTQKTLRMEIQTKDRNIRIIWFSHQPSKQESSSESYKGI